MLCRECSYDLSGLGAGRCPECSCPFDPANPVTFETATERRRRRSPVTPVVLLAVAPWLLMAVVYLAALVHLVQFGGFPGAGAGERPAAVAGSGVLRPLSVVCSLATVLVVPVAMVTVAFVLSERLRRGALTLLLFFVLWLPPVWVLSADPFGVVGWWFG